MCSSQSGMRSSMSWRRRINSPPDDPDCIFRSGSRRSARDHRLHGRTIRHPSSPSPAREVRAGTGHACRYPDDRTDPPRAGSARPHVPLLRHDEAVRHRVRADRRPARHRSRPQFLRERRACAPSSPCSTRGRAAGATPPSSPSCSPTPCATGPGRRASLTCSSTCRWRCTCGSAGSPWAGQPAGALGDRPPWTYDQAIGTPMAQ